MAAATEDRETPRQDGVLVAHPVGAAARIYQGTLVATSGANAVAGTDTASRVFAGVSFEGVDNTSGGAGDKQIRCYKKGLFTFAYTGTAPTRGAKLFIVDDQTVQAAATTNSICCGRAERVDTAAGTVDIDISRYD